MALHIYAAARGAELLRWHDEKLKDEIVLNREIIMKKIILTTAIMFALGGVANAQTVKLGTEGGIYAPWNFIDDNGKIAGFEIDLGNDLCKRAKIECEWVINEWDTIIPNLVAGNYDAIIAGMSITDERKQNIDFTQDYYPPYSSRFLMLANTKVDFNNLKGVKIGVPADTIQEDYVQKKFAKENMIFPDEGGFAFKGMKDLIAGNIDILFNDASYLALLVEELNVSLIFGGSDVFLGDDVGVGIGLRKGDSELKAKLNKAIDEAKADGSLDALIEKWFKKGRYALKRDQYVKY